MCLFCCLLVMFCVSLFCFDVFVLAVAWVGGFVCFSFVFVFGVLFCVDVVCVCFWVFVFGCFRLCLSGLVCGGWCLLVCGFACAFALFLV